MSQDESTRNMRRLAEAGGDDPTDKDKFSDVNSSVISQGHPSITTTVATQTTTKAISVATQTDADTPRTRLQDENAALRKENKNRTRKLNQLKAIIIDNLIQYNDNYRRLQLKYHSERNARIVERLPAQKTIETMSRLLQRAPSVSVTNGPTITSLRKEINDLKLKIDEMLLTSDTANNGLVLSNHHGGSNAFVPTGRGMLSGKHQFYKYQKTTYPCVHCAKTYKHMFYCNTCKVFFCEVCYGGHMNNN